MNLTITSRGVPRKNPSQAFTAPFPTSSSLRASILSFGFLKKQQALPWTSCRRALLMTELLGNETLSRRAAVLQLRQQTSYFFRRPIHARESSSHSCPRSCGQAESASVCSINLVAQKESKALNKCSGISFERNQRMQPLSKLKRQCKTLFSKSLNFL